MTTCRRCGEWRNERLRPGDAYCSACMARPPLDRVLSVVVIVLQIVGVMILALCVTAAIGVALRPWWCPWWCGETERAATPRASEMMANASANEPVEEIMQFFSYAHLPPDLQSVSKVFADAAEEVLRATPRCAERTVALRKLLEAKDAAVRAKLAKPTPWRDRASGVVAEHSELPPAGEGKP